MDEQYLYRHDSLDALRSQRRSDRVLRGRRRTGDEEFFPHHQAAMGHANLKAGEGVFCLSFWKSWSIMCTHRRNGWVVQRIRADHPALEAFQRDDDEYLEQEAWIYWATMRLNPEKPDWAPNGIPHEDIEVLKPDGTWAGMDDIPALNDGAESGWTTLKFISGEWEFPIHIRAGNVATGERVVLLRKPIGPWPNQFIMLTGAVIEVIETLLDVEPDLCSRDVRWIFSQETTDGVVAEEIFPVVRPPRASWLARLTGQRSTWLRAWRIALPDGSVFLSADETRRIYVAFAIENALDYQARWNYERIARLTPS